MMPECQSPADRLWAEYREVFNELDDLTLGRWLSQTLCQFRGRVWRLSHPLVGTYRLAAQVAKDREIWQKTIADMPCDYHAADCCACPILPLFSRDIAENGLICEHCGGTAVPFDSLADELKPDLSKWAKGYGEVHQIAHWSDERKEQIADYSARVDAAAKQAEHMLRSAWTRIVPRFLDFFPSILWEDQDECLDVRPEDIHPD